MKKKIIGIFVCMLMISAVVLPVSGTLIIDSASKPLLYRGTLYVGGSGPGNYSSIQSAINDAVSGDTVFVYDDSSPYLENVTVDKSIQLIGEEKNTTIIDCEGNGSVIFISNDQVTVSGFTLQNSGHDFYNRGVEIRTNYNLITGNIIRGNTWGGIYIYEGSGNVIRNNIIRGNTGSGIYINEGLGNVIRNNIIRGNTGIGIHIDEGSGNVIRNNNFEDNSIYLFLSKNNLISKNNFFKGEASFDYTFNYIFKERKNYNEWTSNYWFRSRYFPKFIKGSVGTIQGWGLYIPLFPWIQIDWAPAQEPYDIGV
jgi:parallel beta-helix repeat protein